MAPSSDSSKPALPSLPIVTVESNDLLERKTDSDKYGSFRYLAIGGLIALIVMISWFSWSVWTLRDVWRDIYILHNTSESEGNRLNAAARLAQNSDVTERQRYDISLRRDLPDAARYLIAEALTVNAMTGSPRAYAMAVARSEGWPDWLRLLHLRPLAYGSGSGEAIDQDALKELSTHDDPVIRVWACYTLAESSRYDPFGRDCLLSAAEGPVADLAAILIAAYHTENDRERDRLLDRATDWIRTHHPEAVMMWSRWTVEQGQFIALSNKGKAEAVQPQD